MVNFRIISKILGSLLFIEAFFMAWCVVIAFSYHEDDQMAFLMSMLVTFGSGFLFFLLGKDAENFLNRHDAFLLVTSVWVIFSLFGMFPFLIHGCLPDVTDAFFESTSGFTTTGATVFADVECLPHGILFWRSLMQWVGALGIVAAEATGPIKAKMHPRLTTTAKWIWSIYLVLTIGCGLAYWLAGMDWFEATNYSMTTTATGGFSIHNEGTIHYQSPAIDYISIIFQFLAGVNFTLLYVSIFKYKVGAMFKNSEFRLYLSVVFIATLWIMYMLITTLGYDVEPAFRHALYQVVAFITTTGTFSDDVARWPHITWIILGVVMYLGACAGSTSGGFKCIRGVMLLKVIQNNFRQALHPNAVLPVKVNGQNVPRNRLISLMAFFTMTILMIAVTTSVMLVSGIDTTNSFVIALSCVRWLLCLLMLMGRLEIMTVLVLFTRSFWKEN